MADISNEEKRRIISKIMHSGSYKLDIELKDIYLTDFYNLFAKNIIPNETNDPIILRCIGLYYYYALTQDIQKSEEYFVKALENGCMTSAYDLAEIYRARLDIGYIPPEKIVYSTGNNYNKYIKYLKLSLNGPNPDACCELLKSKVDLPPDQHHNIIMIGVNNGCAECILKLVKILFKQNRFEESLYLCNASLIKINKLKNTYSYKGFSHIIYNFIGKNTVKLKLHKEYNRRTLIKNKNIRIKLAEIYSKDVGDIIMNYYTIKLKKELAEKHTK